MSAFILGYPVRTLENRVLMPGGTELSPEAMEALVRSAAAEPGDVLPLLGYGSIREDLFGFLGVPPYRTIFPGGVFVEVMKDMEEVSLVAPALGILDFFRRNDHYTYRHFLTVFALSTLLARDLVPDYRDRLVLGSTGPTHDLGKICVPLGVLKKTTPLTRSERGVLESHTAAGYVLLSYYLRDHQSLASRVAMDHHERRDGSGYPRGVAGESIALAARIVALAR